MKATLAVRRADVNRGVDARGPHGIAGSGFDLRCAGLDGACVAIAIGRSLAAPRAVRASPDWDAAKMKQIAFGNRRSCGALVLALLVHGCGTAAPPGGPIDAPPGAPAPASPPAYSPGRALPPPTELPAPAVVESHAEVHPLAADIVAMRQVVAARISPDGARVAYVLRVPSFDPKAKPSDKDATGGWKVEKQLFVIGRSGGEARQLTRSKDPVLSFQWAPDGRSIALMRKQGDAARLQILPVDGGEAEVIETGGLEPEAYAWSPDGKYIAFTAAPPPSDAKKEADFRSGGVVDQGSSYPPSYLFVVPRAGGEPRRITRGPEHVASFDWSPDGARFAITTAKSSDPYEASARVSARVIGATDGALIQEMEASPRVIESMRWSPDSRKVAYLRGDDTFSMMNVLIVYDFDSKKGVNAAAGMDVTLGGYAWSADSKRLTLRVLERTYSKLVQVSAGGGGAKDLGPTARLVTSDIGETDTSGKFAAVTSETSSEPSALSVLDIEKGAVKPLVQPNPQTAGWKVGVAEVVRWKNRGGREIEGLFTPSPTAPAGKPSPLVVLPHGGPDAVSQASFSALSLYLAARGYSVFRPNYRGSLGYGRAFYAENRGALGGVELDDIESGVDWLIQSGKVDAGRLYYGGWSWGGYITAFTIGSTKRYRAAVVGAGVIDVVAQYVLSDINHGVVADWEFMGNPWKAPQRFDSASPLRLLHNVVTPTLVAHGDADQRVPAMHGMIVYRALSDIGCEVRLLRYPREPHGFQEPAHMAHLLANWGAWYDTH